MAQPLLKLPLLLAVALGMNAGLTPPRVPTHDERKTFDDGAREAVSGVGTWGPRLIKLLTNTTQLWEVALISLNHLPTPSTPALAALQHTPSLLSALRISSRLYASPAFLVGAALVCSGAYLRRACFARLGAQFTFELSVQKDHRLVTDGPYAVVRHPSYGAALMQAIGLMVCLGAPGSWWAEAGLWNSSAGKALTLLVCGFMSLCTIGGIDRTFKEDAIMQRMFGAQWDEWAKRTPYRMIPYVF